MCIEVTLKDLKPSVLRRELVRMASKNAMRPGDAALKAAEMEDEDEDESDDENESLVSLVEETRGKSKAPEVLEDDLPADVVAANNKKKPKKEADA